MWDLLDIIKALADENRLRALMMLREGELCVCQIIEMLGLAPSTVSKHMSILRQVRLVESRKEGRWMYYRLNDEASTPSVMEALQWICRHLTQDKKIRDDNRVLKKLLKTRKEDLCQKRKKK